MADSGKKYFVKNLVVFCIPVCFVVNFTFFGCVNSPKPTDNNSNRNSNNGNELDVSIREASNYLNSHISKGNKLVILNFQSEYPALSEYVIDELVSNTVNDRVFTVVDRANLALIQQETNFQMSGEVSDEAAVTIGQMLGAQVIVSGAISQIGDLFRLRVRALDVETAQILGQFNRNIVGDTTIAILVKNNVKMPGNAATSGMAGTQTQSAATTNTQALNTATTATQTQNTAKYKIGDTGPAGGIIFYDKGNSVGGWRYLEAAPPETERQSGLTSRTSSTSNNSLVGSQKVGEGKGNTKKFMDLFEQQGGWINTAVWICSELVLNGFDDWYMPNNDELLYMYNNLHLNGLGGFKNEKYWSSYVSGSWRIFDVDFSDGSLESPSSSDRIFRVRAIRQF